MTVIANRELAGTQLASIPVTVPTPEALPRQMSDKELTELSLAILSGAVKPQELPPADRAAFEQATMATLSDAAVNVEADLTSVLAAAAKLAQNMKVANAQLKAAASRGAINAELLAADLNEKAANLRHSAAMTSATFDMAGAATQIVAGAGQGYFAGKAYTATGTSTTATKATVEGQAAPAGQVKAQLAPEHGSTTDADTASTDYGGDGPEGQPHPAATSPAKSSATTEGGSELAQRKEHDLWKSREQITMQLGNALTTLLSASGKMESADLQKSADMADIGAKKFTTESEKLKNDADQLGELMATLKATAEAAVDAGKTIMNDRHQSTQQIINNV